MSALLTLAKSLGIDPGPLNQADLQEQTCSRALVEIQHLWNQLDKDWKYGCTPADAKKLRERNELAAKVERLRGEITAIMGDSSGVAGYHLNGEIARWGEFSELEEILSETPHAALAALKAQWQSDILAEISLQVSASKPVATPIQIATAILTESKRIRQRAREAGDE